MADNQQQPWQQPMTMDEDAVRYHEMLNAFLRAGFTRAEGIGFIAGMINTVTAESVRYGLRRQQGGAQ